MSADVYVVLAVKPSRINFGHVKRGTELFKYISLIGSDKDSVKIVSVKSRNKYIKVKTNPEGYNNNKDQKIMVTLMPGMRVGPFRDRITIETDHSTVKKLSLSVRGEILGAITVRPRAFSFGLFKKGNAPEKTIILRANPPATFKVTGVKSTSPDIETELVTVREGEEYQVKARVREAFDNEYMRGRIIINTDNKEQGTIEVKFFGRLIKTLKKDKPVQKKTHQKTPGK